MRIKHVIAFFCFSLFGALGAAWAAEPEPTGAAFCVTCHDEDDLPGMSRSAHGFLADKRAPDCLDCHGPSKAHAYDKTGSSPLPKPDVSFGKLFGKLTTNEAHTRSQACQSCHDKDHKRTLWSGSQHEAADVACDNCHKVHANHDKVLTKAGQTEVCYTCHAEQRSQLAKPSHHPIPEGKMTCSDCHNTHGSAGPKLVKRDTINDTCYTCHAEKRGPFVQQHEPVAENCVNCHNSHGSVVAGMLTARAPLLCQQCHTPHVSGGVGALGGQSGVYAPAAAGQAVPQITSTTNGKNVVNMWQGRSCMNCHTQVHGSNSPSITNPLMR
ncbi:DmsE family decaheme c-type cytochrome [Rhodoferax sp.]|uniref:DmsE family decaheme c-type cytochrome n=1 Tax=Rhodoferax sp. TaxID=50421 RepID=UPI0008B7ACC7|nr:DmsE family decaheme c-type cytochrome [Rhodoferax sp.]MDO8320633.1 DmsE family decaheme c-type cytochrome [Rhodoferax sp.]MDP2680082.1 DmsE family decaheme c-type cytochrome [Rhodoferax sp.]OGB55922.1 MAG: cytochrome C [Burkholderiales bacterium RIFOXYD12_FULL_59_19]OGB85309.1 MAG: cytochrome C [Burkholderiales bacterium RIFOXYD2_FULL_59_8]